MMQAKFGSSMLLVYSLISLLSLTSCGLTTITVDVISTPDSIVDNVSIRNTHSELQVKDGGDAQFGRSTDTHFFACVLMIAFITILYISLTQLDCLKRRAAGAAMKINSDVSSFNIQKGDKMPLLSSMSVVKQKFEYCWIIDETVESQDAELKEQKTLEFDEFEEVDQDNPSVDVDDKDSTDNAPDWMSRLPDDWSITQVSIPGTNESCTFKCSGGLMYRTQSWNLEKQLSNGIRFLKARCWCDNSKVKVYVYNMKQYVDFTDELIATCLRFLEQNANEFIVLMISDGWDQGEIFTECLRNLCQPIEKFWLKSDIPTVEQARGKIVLLSKLKGNLGISIDRPESAQYFYEPIIVDSKWEQIEGRLQECCQHSTNIIENGVTRLSKGQGKRSRCAEGLSGPDQGVVDEQYHNDISPASRNNKSEMYTGTDRKLFVTNTTGSSSWAYPYAVSERINIKLKKFLENSRNQIKDSIRKKGSFDTYGCIVMDYPSVSLVKDVIETNF